MKIVKRAAGAVLAFALAGTTAYTTSAAMLFTRRAVGSTENVTLTGAQSGFSTVQARMAGTSGFVTLTLLFGDASVTAQVFGLNSSGQTLPGCQVILNGPATGGDPIASTCNGAAKYQANVFWGN